VAGALASGRRARRARPASRDRGMDRVDESRGVRARRRCGAPTTLHTTGAPRASA
jgi:hypothetical protein